MTSQSDTLYSDVNKPWNDLNDVIDLTHTAEKMQYIASENSFQ